MPNLHNKIKRLLNKADQDGRIFDQSIWPELATFKKDSSSFKEASLMLKGKRLLPAWAVTKESERKRCVFNVAGQEIGWKSSDVLFTMGACSGSFDHNMMVKLEPQSEAGTFSKFGGKSANFINVCDPTFDPIACDINQKLNFGTFHPNDFWTVLNGTYIPEKRFENSKRKILIHADTTRKVDNYETGARAGAIRAIQGFLLALERNDSKFPFLLAFNILCESRHSERSLSPDKVHGILKEEPFIKSYTKMLNIRFLPYHKQVPSRISSSDKMSYMYFARG